MWTIHIRDPRNRRQGMLDIYERLDAVKRLNRVGTWLVDLSLLTSDGVDKAAMLAQPGWGIEIVRDDGTPLFSGPVERIERKRDENSNTLTVSGVDDMCHLADKLVHPQPATAVPPYSASADYTATGVASTVLRTAVGLNCGPSALPGRQKLTLGADPLVGSSIPVRGRWANLLGWLEGYALAAGGLAFEVVQEGTDLEFRIRQPTDKSGSVKFSLDLGNMLDYQYSLVSPKANYVVCGGGGEGALRTIQEGSSPSDIVTWGRRIELFHDRRDTSDPAELGHEISKTLEENKAETTVAFTPIALPGMEFMTNYNLGDRVAAVVDDTITDLIREVKIVSTPDESTITPSIGTPSASEVLAMVKKVRDFEARVSKVERR